MILLNTPQRIHHMGKALTLIRARGGDGGGSNYTVNTAAFRFSWRPVSPSSGDEYEDLYLIERLGREPIEKATRLMA